MKDRIRGRRLQEIRARHFRHAPLCVHCYARGVIREWEHLDHIVALANGGKDVASNRQGLCAECHAEKTRKDLGQAEQTRFDASGRVIW